MIYAGSGRPGRWYETAPGSGQPNAPGRCCIVNERPRTRGLQRAAAGAAGARAWVRGPAGAAGADGGRSQDPRGRLWMRELERGRESICARARGRLFTVAAGAPNIPFCAEGFSSLLLSLCSRVANLLEFLTWLRSGARADHRSQLRLCTGPTPPLIPE